MPAKRSKVGRPRKFAGSTITIGVKLPDVQYARLSAATHGKDLSDFVREAIDEKLERDGAPRGHRAEQS